MNVRIAVAQMGTKPYQTGANLSRAEQFVARASHRGAQVIVFPEDFLTGMLGWKPELLDGNGRYRKVFQGFAQKYHIDIVAGSILEKEQGKVYNTCYYIDRTGKVLARHRKVHLWPAERAWITPGRGRTVARTRYGTVGLAVCWDMMFPEHLRALVKRGAEIIFCPSSWAREDTGIGLRHDKRAEVKLIDSLSVGRAFENGVVFVFCNGAGVRRAGGVTDTAAGHSQICVPFKGAIAKLNHGREGMLVYTVDMAILKDAEKVYQIRRDLR